VGVGFCTSRGTKNIISDEGFVFNKSVGYVEVKPEEGLSDKSTFGKRESNLRAFAMLRA
jgi:hypothetical protein